MLTRPERRRVARLPIPSQFSGPEPESQPVCLTDLSREGARMEHDRPLPDWKMCYLSLPLALGSMRH